MSSLMLLHQTGAGPDQHGLYPLELVCSDPKGSKKFTVFSGQPYAQKFRRADDPQSIPKSNEPLPEGYYDVTRVDWAGGQENDWSGRSWGEGIGAAWADILPRQNMRRSAFGVHLDDNKGYAPGSSGCIVFWTIQDYEAWNSWRKLQGDLVELRADWGLGLVQQEKPPVPTYSQKIYLNDNKCRAFSDGKEVAELSLSGLRTKGSSGHFRVGDKEVFDVVSAELVLVRRRQP